MIQRDVLLRQVQQLAQALAMMLFNKKERRPDLAEDSLTQALRQVFGRDRDELVAMDREDILALCSPGNVYSADLALALADLLREDGAPEKPRTRRMALRICSGVGRPRSAGHSRQD